jgi:phage terminase small subunit
MREKYRKFCIEYVNNGGNATRAFIACGYKNKSPRRGASVLLRRDDIREYINELRDQQFRNDALEVGYVIEKLKDIVEKGTQTKTKLPNARESGRGIRSHQEMIDSYAANVALKTLSSFCPQSTERRELTLKTQKFRIAGQEISFE